MNKICQALLLSAAVATVLTACGPAPVTPAATSTAAPTPSATVTPVATVFEAPWPAIDVDCGDLVSAATLGGLFTSGVAEVDPERTSIEAANNIPYKYAAEQLGGIACEWSNGQPQSTKTGDNPAYKGTAVTIAPVSAAAWTEFASYYGLAGDRQVYCFDDCYADLFVGGRWWVEVSLESTDAGPPLSAFTAQVAAIEATITAASPVAAGWTAPDGTVALGTCEAILPIASVQSALAIASPLVASPPYGGVSLDGTARSALDALWCNFMPTDFDATAGTMHWLPGGEWAFNEARTFGLIDAPLEAIDVAGLETGDSAWLRCPASGGCTVDLIVGHNWIQFARQSDDVPSTADRRTALLAIAAAIVDSVR